MNDLVKPLNKTNLLSLSNRSMEASCGLNTRQIQGYLRLRLKTNATMDWNVFWKKNPVFMNLSFLWFLCSIYPKALGRSENPETRFFHCFHSFSIILNFTGSSNPNSWLFVGQLHKKSLCLVKKRCYGTKFQNIRTELWKV